jgi:hypothetical protein
MFHGTMVFGANQGRSEIWRVYRIRTANSTYHLEVEAQSARYPRRVAVLTCLEPHSRAGESHEDSSPKAGGESLFVLSPMEWIGKCLTVGTVRTSELVSVDFISSAETRSAKPRPSAPAPAPVRQHEPEPPRWAPFPAGQVEMAEVAASLLKTVCHRRDLADALRADPRLRRRFEMALSECGLMLEAINER